MKLLKIQCEAILLDLDGTLIDADAAAVKYWTNWAQSVGVDPQAVLQARRSGRRRDVIAEFLPGLSEERLADEVARMRETALANVKHVVALPGAKRLLAELPERRWAIVTSNDREVALARLRAAGLPEPDVLVAAEDVAKGKPDPEGYIAAARLLGVKPSEAVVVDDSVSGIEAANTAGMTAIAILGSDKAARDRQEVVASVEDLTEITAKVDGSDIVLTISLTARSDSGPRPQAGIAPVVGGKLDKSPTLTRQRLEDVKWHLARYDTLRISLASRGALVLSADALIAAGSTVLVGQWVTRVGSLTAAVTLTSVLSLLCVGVSVTFASVAIINIRPWRLTHKESPPRSIFFDASDTLAMVQSFQDFECTFLNADEEVTLRYAIVDLWKCITSYKHRYARLRTALQFLFVALWVFLVAVALQFAALPVR